jgi:hypothetical protein
MLFIFGGHLFENIHQMLALLLKFLLDSSHLFKLNGQLETVLSIFLYLFEYVIPNALVFVHLFLDEVKFARQFLVLL